MAYLRTLRNKTLRRNKTKNQRLRRNKTKNQPRRTLRSSFRPISNIKPIVILGKIYSIGCGHCSAMANDWNMMKNKLETSKTVQYEIWDIESAEEDAKKSEFLQKHGIALSSSGYPTIFMIVQGKQVDYNGDRDAASLEQWAKSTVYNNKSI